jgi:hypothetical protein
MILFRPVGFSELELIAEMGFTAFPPPRQGQIVFYPETSEAYAHELARDRNTHDEASGFAGFVTRFFLDDGFAARQEIKSVGSSRQELWVKASELAVFNEQIVGSVEVVATYKGARYTPDE